MSARTLLSDTNGNAAFTSTIPGGGGGGGEANAYFSTITVKPTSATDSTAIYIDRDSSQTGALIKFIDSAQPLPPILAIGTTINPSSRYDAFISSQPKAGGYGSASGVLNFTRFSTITMNGSAPYTSTILNVDGIVCGTINGSVPGVAGVTQLVAGDGIALNPTGGTGVVTVSALAAGSLPSGVATIATGDSSVNVAVTTTAPDGFVWGAVVTPQANTVSGNVGILPWVGSPSVNSFTINVDFVAASGLLFGWVGVLVPN